MYRTSNWWSIAMTVLVLSGIAFAQTAVRQRTVVVNGKSGEAMVYEIDGKFFIELETLARISGGSLSYEAKQIVLRLPAVPANAPAPTPADGQPPNTGLSDAFMKAAIQTLGTIEDWRTKLAYGVQRGIPGDGSQLFVFRDKSAEALRQSTAAASNDSDRNALQLLTNQFNNLQDWTNKMVQGRKNMDSANYSMSPSALNNDTLYQKIVSCSTFLGTMLPSGTFTNDGSCN